MIVDAWEPKVKQTRSCYSIKWDDVHILLRDSQNFCWMLACKHFKMCSCCSCDHALNLTHVYLSPHPLQTTQISITQLTQYFFTATLAGSEQLVLNIAFVIRLLAVKLLRRWFFLKSFECSCVPKRTQVVVQQSGKSGIKLRIAATSMNGIPMDKTLTWATSFSFCNVSRSFSSYISVFPHQMMW